MASRPSPILGGVVGRRFEQPTPFLCDPWWTYKDRYTALRHAELEMCAWTEGVGGEIEARDSYRGLGTDEPVPVWKVCAGYESDAEVLATWDALLAFRPAIWWRHE
jgi:hypothetical protein